MFSLKELHVSILMQINGFELVEYLAEFQFTDRKFTIGTTYENSSWLCSSLDPSVKHKLRGIAQLEYSV